MYSLCAQIIVLAGGCLLFGDEMPPQRLVGVALAMAGIVYYSYLKLNPPLPEKEREKKDGRRPSVPRVPSRTHSEQNSDDEFL